MNPIKIKNIFEFIKGDCDIPLGIHTHDNLGLALSNSLAALDYGAEWVDSTILGMGRGPGNCKTEEILIELNNSKGLHKISPIIEIISKHFLKLKNLHKWGTNPYYYIGGKFGIHPSYIQEIMNDKLFSPDDKLALIEKLKNKKPTIIHLNIALVKLSNMTLKSIIVILNQKIYFLIEKF